MHKDLPLAQFIKYKLSANSFGIWTFLRTEFNAKPLIFVSVCNIAFGFILKYDRYEAMIMIFAFVMMWVAEMLNTAIERTIDLVTQEHKPLAKQAKDIAGAGVMLASLNTIVMFIIVNLP